MGWNQSMDRVSPNAMLRVDCFPVILRGRRGSCDQFRGAERDRENVSWKGSGRSLFQELFPESASKN